MSDAEHSARIAWTRHVRGNSVDVERIILRCSLPCGASLWVERCDSVDPVTGEVTPGEYWRPMFTPPEPPAAGGIPGHCSEAGVTRAALVLALIQITGLAASVLEVGQALRAELQARGWDVCGLKN